MCEREEITVLAQRVEIDEAYRGEERRGDKVGRSSENKISLQRLILADRKATRYNQPFP
jgi:hypothetical protein